MKLKTLSEIRREAQREWEATQSARRREQQEYDEEQARHREEAQRAQSGPKAPTLKYKAFDDGEVVLHGQ